MTSFTLDGISKRSVPSSYADTCCNTLHWSCFWPLEVCFNKLKIKNVFSGNNVRFLGCRDPEEGRLNFAALRDWRQVWTAPEPEGQFDDAMATLQTLQHATGTA